MHHKYSSALRRGAYFQIFVNALPYFGGRGVRLSQRRCPYYRPAWLGIVVKVMFDGGTNSDASGVSAWQS